MKNWAASSGNSNDINHWRLNANSGSFCLIDFFTLSWIISWNVSWSAAHIESDELVYPQHFGNMGITDYTSRWPRNDCILGCERISINQSPTGLHKFEWDYSRISSHLLDIFSKDGIEVSINRCRIASTDNLLNLHGLRRKGNLCKSNTLSNFAY